MAQKRAYVGAILNATGASEFFTQDVEDMGIATSEVIEVKEVKKEEKNQTSSVVSGQNQASDHGQMIQNLKTQYLTGEAAKIVDQ